MTPERLQALEEELIRYTNDFLEGKDYEINCLEIRTKLDAFNTEIDELTEGGHTEDLQMLSFIAYQYYQLLYT